MVKLDNHKNISVGDKKEAIKILNKYKKLFSAIGKL